MKTRILLTVAAAALSVSINASAQGDRYFGLDYGQSSLDTGVSNLTGTAKLDEKDSSFKLLFGTKINNNLAIEGIYVDFGEAALTGNPGDTFDSLGSTWVFASSATVKVNATGFGANVKGIVPISDSLSAYGLAGLIVWDGKSVVNGVSVGDNGSDLFYGAGVSYDLTESMSLDLSLESYTLGDLGVTRSNLGFTASF